VGRRHGSSAADARGSFGLRQRRGLLAGRKAAGAGTGAVLQTLEGPSESVNAVAFLLDGKLLASASHDRTVKLCVVRTLSFSDGGTPLMTDKDCYIPRLFPLAQFFLDGILHGRSPWRGSGWLGGRNWCFGFLPNIGQDALRSMGASLLSGIRPVVCQSWNSLFNFPKPPRTPPLRLTSSYSRERAARVAMTYECN
jgi:hypothetical protein